MQKVLIPFIIIFFCSMTIASEHPLNQERDKSCIDFQFEELEVQSLNLSCGLAGLSTLIKNLTGIEITQEEMLKQIENTGDEQLSMVDFMKILDAYPDLSLSYKCYKTNAQSLYDNFNNSLVNVVLDAGDHFVLFKKYSPKTDMVCIIDPSLGNLLIPRSLFEMAFYATTFSQKYSLENLPLGAVFYVWENI